MLGGAQIEEHGEEKEQPADHIAPLGDPGDRLDPQRVNREDEAREGRRAEASPRGDLASVGRGEGDGREEGDEEGGGEHRPGGRALPRSGGATSDQRYAPFPSGRNSTPGRHRR